MTFVLLMFWWGPSAAQLKSINFPSEQKCEEARTKIVKFTNKVSGSFEAICVEAK